MSEKSFQTTAWTQVLAAGKNDLEALELVSKRYWSPLYHFAKFQGLAHAKAEDLTQDFWLTLIEKGHLERADAEKGRFRTFILTLFKRHLVNAWQKEHRQKRGGFSTFEDLSSFEDHLASSESQQGFDREWAKAVLDSVMNSLQSDWEAKERADLFGELKHSLDGSLDLSHKALAEKHGLSESHVSVLIHRLKQQYLRLLREEISKTVLLSDDIDEEIRYLLGALKG